MRVLIADKLSEVARKRLTAAGCEVIEEPGVAGPALAARLAALDPTVLVVRSTEVTRAHVAAAPSLGLVVRAGAGVNTIDLDACSERGTYVANCPGKNAVAVAELTLGLLLAVDRRIPDNVVDFHAGRWNKALYSKARGLQGTTLGVLGTGDIGVEVIRRARAFGVKVVAWSRSLTAERAEQLGVVACASPVEVAARCDALTVHLALAPETAGLVDATVLGAMRPGAVLINTSRAEVVDEAALRDAIGRGLRVGLDVFDGEPSGKDGSFTSPLQGLPGVLVTHHVGASTEQAQQAIADEVCRIVESFRRTGRAPNAVNVAVHTGADRVLVVRHLDRVGVLAGVLGVLREAGINVEEMENTIFWGGNGAVARISVRGALTPDVLARVGANEHVLSATVIDLGGT